MKVLQHILMISLLLIPFLGSSQKKEAKFLEFNNFTATFEVPEGKTWVIESIFSNSVGELITNSDGTTSTSPVRIFIKAMNGNIKTDWQGNRFGPQVFQSNNKAGATSFPLTLPAGTKFSLIMLSGDPGSCKEFNGSGFMSLYEVTNG
jgi:hypothetical protein